MDIWTKFTCIIADAFCVRLEVILGKTAPLKVHFLTTTDQIFFCGEDSSSDWGSGVRLGAPLIRRLLVPFPPPHRE